MDRSSPDRGGFGGVSNLSRLVNLGQPSSSSSSRTSFNNTTSLRPTGSSTSVEFLPSPPAQRMRRPRSPSAEGIEGRGAQRPRLRSPSPTHFRSQGRRRRSEEEMNLVGGPARPHPDGRVRGAQISGGGTINSQEEFEAIIAGIHEEYYGPPDAGSAGDRSEDMELTPLEDDAHPDPPPTAGPSVASATAVPSTLRANARTFSPASASSTRPNSARPSAPPPPREVIDLAGDSDSDEEIQVLRANITVPAFPAGARRPPPRPANLHNRDIDLIEDVLRQREGQFEAIRMEEEDERRRAILSPPPPVPGAFPAPRPRIGLGGAVLAAGDRQINFAPGPVPGASHHRREQPRRLVTLDDEDFHDNEHPATPPRAAAARLNADRAQRRAEVMAANARLPPAPPERRVLGRLFDMLNGWDAEAAQRPAEPQAERFDRAGVDRALRNFQQNFNLNELLAGYRGAGIPGGMEAVIGALADNAAAGPAGAAGAGGVQAIIASVGDFVYTSPTKGFTRDFSMDAAVPIAVDDQGKVLPAITEPYLACANCPEPLLLSSSLRNDGDRLWALRCGHILDQRCLDSLSIPTTPAELATVVPPLGAELLPAPPRTHKARKRAKHTKPEPREFAWNCPAKGCGMEHRTQQLPPEMAWTQKTGEGAVQMFA